ncbi:MAG: hypothetical protein JOY70_03125 [Acidisphaera sp.]|nr:hypothetical protein [Acidisphaera sp.]MBV9812221.1 hypothetical protein [Acetobacteraceae bacterium]
MRGSCRSWSNDPAHVGTGGGISAAHTGGMTALSQAERVGIGTTGGHAALRGFASAGSAL